MLPYRLPLTLCACLAASPVLAADAPTPAPETNVTRWADRCTDFTRNGWAFKAPANFLQWLDVFSDPGIWLEFGRRGLDPQYAVRSLSSLLDPGTPRNYLEWTNPELYNRWGEALARPDFVTTMNSLLFDPGRMMRWIMLPLDGKTWELAGTAINPVTWVKWLTLPSDPQAQALFAKATDPETARRWLDALGDPKNAPWLHAPVSGQGFQPAKTPWETREFVPASNRL